MSDKRCDKCNNLYAGFGATCADCRKRVSEVKGSSTTVARTSTSGGTNCEMCGKVAYAMEKITVEGLTFHSTCFKCAQCGNKLSPSGFSKSDAGEYYCKVHYQQLFQLRGKYDFKASPSLDSSGVEGVAGCNAATAPAGADAKVGCGTSAPKAPSAPPASLPAAQPTGADSKAYSPEFNSARKLWTIQNIDGNDIITLDKAEKDHKVLLENLKQATIVIKGKVNSVAISSCKKIQVVMNDVVGAVEVMNCAQIKFQISGSCPTASIDKTDGCCIYLMSEEAKKMQLSTSKHSDVQVNFQMGDDSIERPIPEQFVHRLKNDDELVSRVSSLYGGADNDPLVNVSTEGGEAEDDGEPTPPDARVKFEEARKLWLVERQDGGGPIIIDTAEKGHTVLISKCKNATVIVKKKVNSVAVQDCEKCQVAINVVISTLEVTNGKRNKVQVNGVCPSVAVDKTDSCLVYLLSERAKTALIHTSKHSDVQISYMKGDENVERPVPEQFMHTVQADGTIKSVVSSLYG